MSEEYLKHGMGDGKEGGKCWGHKRVAAGAHLRTPWTFEPAKRPDERADYCLDSIDGAHYCDFQHLQEGQLNILP